MRRLRAPLSVVATVAAVALTVSACSSEAAGESGDPTSPSASSTSSGTPPLVGPTTGTGTATEAPADPQSAIESASAAFAKTTGVDLEVSTTGVPDTAQGMRSAIGTGRATPTPAFTGVATTLVDNKVPGALEVVAVGGTVRVRYFSVKWTPANPASYRAPNPADLFTADKGVGELATSVQGLKDDGTTTLDGEKVLAYSGTVPGVVVGAVLRLGSSSASFPAKVYLSEDGSELRRIVLTGPLFATTGSQTFTISLRDYGQDRAIQLPALG